MTLDPSVIVFGGFLVLFLVAVFLLPVIFLFHSLSSEQITGGKRAAWFFSMILAWPIPSYVYAFKSSHSRAMKTLGTVGLCAIVGFFISFGYVVVNVLGIRSLESLGQLGANQKPSQIINRLRLAPLEQVDLLSRRLEHADLSQLNQGQRDQIQSLLGQIQLKLQDENVDENTRRTLQQSIDRLNQALSDKSLSAPEANDLLHGGKP